MSDSTGVDSSEVLLLGNQQCFLVAVGAPGSAGSPWWSTGAQEKSASTLSSMQTNQKALCYSFFICLFWQFGFSYRFKPISLKPVPQVLELTFAIRITSVSLQELRSSFFW